MKKILITGIITFSLFSCSEKEYINENCSSVTSVNQSLTLNIHDTIPGFSGVTGKGSHFSSKNFKKSNLLVFFKTQKYPTGGLLNDEITDNNLGQTAKDKDVDLLIGLDLKAAKIYGVDISGSKINNSMLFVIDKNKIIQKIYKNACEEDIINVLNELETSPNIK